MKFWRISNYADLQGKGGLKASGRWHNRGIPIVYLSESPALALLEVLVNLEMDINDIPKTYQLLEVEYIQPKKLARLHKNALTDGWQHDQELTRAIGDEWLTGASALLMRVPSAIAPKSFNYLLNPRHAEAPNIKIISAIVYPFDERLLR